MTHKLCTYCGVTKTLLEFDARRASLDGRSYKCKDCARAYRNANKERYQKLRSDRYLRHRESEKTKALEYHYQNREKCLSRIRTYQERNAEKMLRWRKWYAQRTKAESAARCNKHRANKILRTPKWLSGYQHAEMQKVYLTAAHIREALGVDVHVDHIVPLNGRTVSGLHVPWNLQIITARENMVKGNRVWA